MRELAEKFGAFRRVFDRRRVLRWGGVCMTMLSLCHLSFVFADGRKPVPRVQPGELGREVNPFIGTGGISYLCGNNFPGATVPFGNIRLSPDTVSLLGQRATNTSGYFYSDTRLLGFSHTWLAGTGATDGGSLLVIPSFAESARSQRRGMNKEYSHQHEVAFPGYYGLGLPRLGLTAEFTATGRVGLHRYTFGTNSDPHLLIHVTNALGKGVAESGEIRVLPETAEIEGTVTTFGTFSKRYGGLKVYFVAKLNRPLQDFTTWSGESFSSTESTVAGDDVGVDVGFRRDGDLTTIELQLAISYVSIENARQNLQQEVGSQTFDQILASAVEQWEQVFRRINVTGGSAKQCTIFRTAMYHAFQMPTAFHDANGQYLGFDGQKHQADGFRYYTDMSLWDTFRTVHPLFNLIARAEQRDMLVSLLKMNEQGGYLPRWPSGAGYTNSMFGTPADIVIAEAYLKGVRNFDVESAYNSMRKTALGSVPHGSRFSGRAGIENYLKHEYCPADLMKKSVASTIEYCYADHSIARLAAALGRHDDASLFDRHAKYYRNLWNPQTQFFQPRDSQGKFVDAFQPELLTYLDLTGSLTHAYVEGSAWQWRWGVPSDASYLVTIFNSKQVFIDELNQFFERSPDSVGANPNAYYWHGNQPDLYAAYLFNYADRPDLTQKWVRWIMEQKYGDRENGLDGNDDGGTLSAWYVFSSLGLYPTAGTDRYEIGSPIWQRAEVTIDNKRLTITAENAAPDHPYIQRVTLNDVPIDRHWITHAEIENGGTLQFEMGPEPVLKR